MTVQDWIRKGRELGASDLHIEAENALVVRVRGQLSSVGASIAGAVVVQAARELLGDGWPQFVSRGSADLSRTIAGVRCRINIFQTVRGVAMAVRLLSAFQNNLRACNLHADLKRLTDVTTGLVVVSGPTGSGKFPRIRRATNRPWSMLCARTPTSSSSAKCALPRSCG